MAEDKASAAQASSLGLVFFKVLEYTSWIIGILATVALIYFIIVQPILGINLVWNDGSISSISVWVPIFVWYIFYVFDILRSAVSAVQVINYTKSTYQPVLTDEAILRQGREQDVTGKTKKPRRAATNATLLTLYQNEKHFAFLFILLYIHHVVSYTIINLLLTNLYVDPTVYNWYATIGPPILLSTVIFFTQTNMYTLMISDTTLEIEANHVYTVILFFWLAIVALFLIVYPARELSSTIAILYFIEIGIAMVCHVGTCLLMGLNWLGRIEMTWLVDYYLITQLVQHFSCLILPATILILWSEGTV
jgi:hypothetical protein